MKWFIIYILEYRKYFTLIFDRKVITLISSLCFGSFLTVETFYCNFISLLFTAIHLIQSVSIASYTRWFVGVCVCAYVAICCEFSYTQFCSFQINNAAVHKSANTPPSTPFSLSIFLYCSWNGTRFYLTP